MKLISLFMFCFAICVNAQVSLSGSGFVQIDFNDFLGAGFSPTPSAGQLDSDTWSVLGLEDGDFAFGETRDTSDYALGLKNHSVNRGGIYSFQIAENNNSLGFQAGEKDLTPGSFILKLRNNTVEVITKLNLSYDIYCYNDKNRKNSINFSHNNDNIDSLFIDEPSLNYESPDNASVAPVWVKTTKQISLTSIHISVGGAYYLKWTTDDVDGSGSRDEFAIDNITLSAGDEPLPVELISFTSKIKEGHVLLEWSTATETNNYGFEIQRSTNSRDWERIGFIDGNGTSAVVNSYSFFDNLEGSSGRIYYRLKQIDIDGTYEYSPTIEVLIEAPIEFNLQQNYPNPFNPTTTIKYLLPVNDFVDLKIYNMLGEEVATLVSEFKNAGTYTLQWDANGFPSGIYIYEIRIQNFRRSKKLILLK